MSNKMKGAVVAALAAMGAAASAGVQAVPAFPFADVVVLMDESGSMSGEQAWIKPTITTLDAKLVGEGLTPNNYGSVGFAVGGGPGLTRYFNMPAAPAPATSNTIAGLARPFGTAADFQTLTYSTGGGTEDGWAAITAANQYSFRANSARNYILVTDEDRDSTGTSNTLTYAGVLASMTGTKTLLNAIVDATFRCSLTGSVLGIDSKGNCFVADGQGGYNKGTGGVAVSGFNNTIADYVNMALATGGAAWNLNLLRGGGTTATSFTAAFIDIKVQEIITPPADVPEPGSLALLGIAGLAFGLARRRKH
ncbi:MAG: PEP-CTERM sorting domain-containing protein [Burkholderiales bacterium]|nr:PEP-CTERM sorting domain-containing protein [Burkholderiales bacterium]